MAQDIVRDAHTDQGAPDPQRFEFVTSYEVEAAKKFGCWNWTGRVSKDGYPVFSKTSMFVRPYAAEFYELPGSGRVYALCGNRLCVSPDHLVRASERSRLRRDAEKRIHAARDAYCSKGHWLGRGNARWRLNQGRMSVSCRICEKMYRDETGRRTPSAPMAARRPYGEYRERVAGVISYAVRRAIRSYAHENSYTIASFIEDAILEAEPDFSFDRGRSEHRLTYVVQVHPDVRRRFEILLEEANKGRTLGTRIAAAEMFERLVVGHMRKLCVPGTPPQSDAASASSRTSIYETDAQGTHVEDPATQGTTERAVSVRGTG
jgi:hypothetical protein